MTNTEIFAILIVVIVSICFWGAFRELYMLSRLPAHHPDRGPYWFNSLFLFVAVLAVATGFLYLNERKNSFEALIMPYPNSWYAFERNAFVQTGVWIYESEKGADDILLFYRDYAAKLGVPMSMDHNDGVERGAFTFPYGELFLTIKDEDGTSVLYFSLEGKKKLVNR